LSIIFSAVFATDSLLILAGSVAVTDIVVHRLMISCYCHCT